jgi:hypothetical protein
MLEEEGRETTSGGDESGGGATVMSETLAVAAVGVRNYAEISSRETVFGRKQFRVDVYLELTMYI